MFIVQMPALPPMPLEMLMKLAGHPEDRLLERTELPLEALAPIRAGAHRAQLPPGSHHVRLPDGSYAVLKDVSKRGGQPRHVLATVLSSEMSPPGYDVTQEVIDIDPDDVKVISFSEGDKAKRGDTLRTKERHGKNSHSFEVERTHHSVKVAAAPDEGVVRARLRELKHDKETLRKYIRVLERDNVYLTKSVDELPKRDCYANDSRETEEEIREIVEAMERQDLDPDFVQRVGESVNGVFGELCEHLGVDPRTDIAHDIARDALRASMVFKYHYLRPRPHVIAPYFDMDIHGDHSSAGETPAYPSGHSMMGFALARLYAQMYPEHSERFHALADKVGESRIQAGVHYPSDVRYAEELVDALMGTKPREKTASIMGAAIGASFHGEGVKEKAIAATGGATGGLVGGIAGLGAGWAGSALLGAGFAGKSVGGLIGNTIGAGVGGYYGGQYAVSAHRKGLKRTPNLDKRVRGKS